MALPAPGVALISFRYHVVTIVAVFFALALGLLAGSAFVQPRLEGELRSQSRSQLQRIHEQDAQIGQLRAFTDGAILWLTSDRLVGTRVVIFTQEDVPGGVVSEAQRSLTDAGAQIVATFSARAKLVSQDPADVRELAQIAGRPDAVAADVPSIVANAIAQRLSGGPVPGPHDVLHDLLSAGFLTGIGSQVSDATLKQIGGTGQAVVVVSGGPQAQPAVPPEQFAVPLTQDLRRLGVPVAAGQASDAGYPFVEVLRASGGDGLVTVDDLDLSMGGAAMVLGLQELMTNGRGGAYGFAEGAAPLPTPS
jgi:Copper transport outer membrane protein, MctB